MKCGGSLLKRFIASHASDLRACLRARPIHCSLLASRLSTAGAAGGSLPWPGRAMLMHQLMPLPMTGWIDFSPGSD